MRKPTDMVELPHLAEQSEGPQYLALRDRIALSIEMGRLQPETRLPSERSFQSGTGAARGTIREALAQLESEGLIYRRDRSGWYVSPPAVTYNPTHWAGFMSYVRAQGRVPGTETLDKSTLPADAGLADIFRVAPGDMLLCIKRRRTIDGRPVLVERIMVDPALAPDLLDHSLDGSLTDILKAHYGIAVARNRVDIRPCALIRETAEQLGVKSGAPGLKVTRTSFDEAGRVVEYDREYWRHDAIRIHVDLNVRA
ncbi:UTRA domain-containing protein [Novosphingobium sp. FKTRR1]|uniref:UTRA domain-containing protein n=1 Tax=Novosphingobium sp. FKTRR1 TaxID=2879118 RepID=UPI001CF087A3|nr:UTRA domain-containing protein [Novosphingobium sp. FKTRR1]